MLFDLRQQSSGSARLRALRKALLQPTCLKKRMDIGWPTDIGEERLLMRLREVLEENFRSEPGESETAIRRYPQLATWLVIK